MLIVQTAHEDTSPIQMTQQSASVLSLVVRGLYNGTSQGLWEGSVCLWDHPELKSTPRPQFESWSTVSRVQDFGLVDMNALRSMKC